MVDEVNKENNRNPNHRNRQSTHSRMIVNEEGDVEKVKFVRPE